MELGPDEVGSLDVDGEHVPIIIVEGQEDFLQLIDLGLSEDPWTDGTEGFVIALSGEFSRFLAVNEVPARMFYSTILRTVGALVTERRMHGDNQEHGSDQ